MRWIVALGIGCLMGSFTGNAFAASRSLSPPVSPCEAIGNLAFTIVQGRDRGIPYATARYATGLAAQRSQASPSWVVPLSEAIAQDAYTTSASIPPQTAKKLLNDVCLIAGIKGVLDLYHIPLEAGTLWR